MNDNSEQALNEARRELQDLMTRTGLSRETWMNLVATTTNTTATPDSISIQSSEQDDEVIQDIKPDPSIDEALSRGVFWSGKGPYNHRPRISISSTSSGSSGRASLWSQTPSFHSTASDSTHYSRSSAPLPPPPSQAQLSKSNSTASNSSQNSAANAAAAAAQAGWGSGRLNFYWCTSCETRFKRKYDWKRHEEEFHERWKKYPCPEPGCNRSFWGANTFNQHHKSSHGCKTCPHSDKVMKYLRKRKYWACGFCAALHPSRERHVEHVARHFESGKTKTDWQHSRVIYGLLHQPLIHEAWKDITMAKQAEFAGRLPNFSWNPNKTGRAQGFMENECPGQLQDLLEFFSGSSADAEAIVRVAFEEADVVFPVFGSPTTTCGNDATTLAYPTPPDSTLSPVTPGSTMQQSQSPQQHPQQHPHQQQQQQPGGMMMGEPTSPTPFPLTFRNPQPMAQPLFSNAQTQPQPQQQTSQDTLRRASLDRALPPPPPGEGPNPQLQQPMQQQLAMQQTVQQQPVAQPPAPSLDMTGYLQPSAMIMDDWGSFSTVVDESVGQPQMPAEWPMVQYFNPQQQ